MRKKDSENSMDYISYEYQEITVPKELFSLCRDSYSCFGWEADRNPEQEQKTGNTVTLYVRRNRAISNKTELTRLQRHFDHCIRELTALEQAKTRMPAILALTVAVLGTAFMAGATFAVTANPPVIWLMILLAVPGLLGWILPYFLYHGLVRRKTMEIDPLIRKKYDEIYRVCEQGNNLLK